MVKVHVFNIGIICIHGKELLRHSIKNTEDLTMKQMFDISAKLVSERSDEVMNKSSVFNAQKSTYFQILYCVLERYTRTLDQT